MDNYKIKVKDEAESKEAQELFFALGVERPDGTANIYHSPTVFGLLVVDGLFNYVFAESVFYDSKAKELTLPQLRDLVVLKRNDVRDANRQAERGGEYFITNDGDIYFWMGKWVPSTLGSIEPLTVIETNQPQYPALINGADVPALIKKGESVQFRSAFNVQGGGEWKDLDLERDEEELSLGDLINTRFEWRLKPQTIKVELELPKPFEPKDGDEYFYISTLQHCLYSHDVWSDEPADITQAAFGAYRTEDEIKQVVEQLRKIRGAS